jgi:hypothetical protein
MTNAAVGAEMPACYDKFCWRRHVLLDHAASKSLGTSVLNERSRCAANTNDMTGSESHDVTSISQRAGTQRPAEWRRPALIGAVKSCC